MDAVFGPLVTGGDVERAALDTLQKWEETYLGWATRAAGRPRPIPPIRSWNTSADIETGAWPRAQPPAVLILSPGLAEPPVRTGRREFRAAFALGFVVVASARGRAESEGLAQLYTAALRTCLIHRASLGGFASGIEWTDERYDVLPDRNREQLAAGRADFRVEVDGVVGGGGPTDPDPPSDPTTPIEDPPVVAPGGAQVEVNAEDL